MGCTDSLLIFIPSVLQIVFADTVDGLVLIFINGFMNGLNKKYA